MYHTSFYALNLTFHFSYCFIALFFVAKLKRRSVGAVSVIIFYSLLSCAYQEFVPTMLLKLLSSTSMFYIQLMVNSVFTFQQHLITDSYSFFKTLSWLCYQITIFPLTSVVRLFPLTLLGGSRPHSNFKLFFCLFILVLYFSGNPLFWLVLTEFSI